MAGSAFEQVPITMQELEADVQPIQGYAAGKHLLSMNQLGPEDIFRYIHEARAAEALLASSRGGAAIAPFQELKVVMQQPSTRTGGSMTTAMRKLGGTAELYSGMQASSEAKGESPADTWVAFATQADIIGTRTPQAFGPAFAAYAIGRSVRAGKLDRSVPIINLGDGTNEHPTQALGDVYTIWRRFFGDSDPLDKRNYFADLNLVMVGDHERYRAFHSLYIAAATLGMRVVAIESPVAQVPEKYVNLLGDKLERTTDLDGAMQASDVLYMGRNPDEYMGGDPEEIDRSRKLGHSYATWVVDADRLQQMPESSVVLHPRPRRDELDSSVDEDPRALDVQQMRNMVPMRMAVLAEHLGRSISESIS